MTSKRLLSYAKGFAPRLRVDQATMRNTAPDLFRVAITQAQRGVLAL